MDQWQVNPYAAPPELKEPSRQADKRIRPWERLVWKAIGFGAFVFVVLAGLDAVRGNAGPLWSDLGFGVMGAIVAWSLHRMASHRTAVRIGPPQRAISATKKAAFSSAQGGT